MRNRILCMLAFLLLGSTGIVFSQGKNVAYQDNEVRFTVVSDGVIRLEWTADGQFVDAPSFVAICRDYPQVDYKLKESNSTVEISTAKMKLKYRKRTGRFTADNLSIVSQKGVSPSFTWKPGMQQQENLKGTLRTLDGLNGDMRGNKKVEIPDGLLARDGWTLLDDSHNFLLDDSDWAWVKQRPSGDVQDWYFMAYGHDYKAALKQFTLFAGKMPLPPRYTFGYWWSRYWAYSDNELRTLVSDFRRYGVPLDVLVVDMDWHHVEEGKGGWTGWTWNERLFPDYRKFLRFVKENDLQVTLNLHPASGMASYEEKYPQVAAAMGLDPAKGEKIPWVSSDKRMMTAMFDHVLHPMEKDGVDFWWLDWQQALYDSRVDSLSNTWWLNYCFFTDMERHRSTRPLLYHRWGGLGNHRYQIGFSGDSYITWQSLDFQPYFNSTASNVLYGYWSHDIGGHMGKPVGPELYTRWLQFGCVSPVVRTHTAKGPGMHKEPWAFGQAYTDIICRTINQRYQLAPYIYAMARKAYEEGLSLCRPLYYDYPENQEAYDFRNEYMFGDQMLVAPVTTPADSTGYARLKIWLPQGEEWYEWHTGTLLQGGQVIERSFALDEYPLYFKAGSILPFYDRVDNLRGNDEEVTVTVFPGIEGSFRMYEDQGNNRDYDRQYATTPLSYKREGNKLSVTIGSRTGSYPEMPSSRKFRVKVESSVVPASVTLDGKALSYEYDGNDLALCISLPERDCSVERVLEITYPTPETVYAVGLQGKFRRVSHALDELKERTAQWPGLVISEKLGFMESAGRFISYHPEKFMETVNRFNDCYDTLPNVLEEQKISEENATLFLRKANWQ